MTPLRVIVAGLGARSRVWLQVLGAHPGTEVVGLCDPDPAARARAQDLVPGARVEEGLDALSGLAPNLVILCTPPSGRAAQIASAAAMGAAILSEKPLAADLATAIQHVEAAEAAGVPLIVGLNFRYLGVTQALRRILRDGTIGQPEFGRFLYERWRDGRQPHLNRYPLTMAQPMLWEQSIHHFDLMRYVYGAEPRRIHARTFNPSWSMYEGDANVTAMIDFEGGLGVTYQGTWAGGLDRLDFDWRTDGTDGVAVQAEMFGALAAGKRSDGALSPVALPPHEPWVSDAAALLAMVVRALRGTAPLECSGRDHLRSLAMVEACILSSARGQPVDLAEVFQTSKESPC